MPKQDDKPDDSKVVVFGPKCPDCGERSHQLVISCPVCQCTAFKIVGENDGPNFEVRVFECWECENQLPVEP